MQEQNKSLNILSKGTMVIVSALLVFALAQTDARDDKWVAQKDGRSKAQERRETGIKSGLPSIDWDPLQEYFTVSNIRIEKQKLQDPLGRIDVFDVLAFTVEVKQAFLIVIFFAHFYDTEGIEVDAMSPVSFEPDYSLIRWSPGVRSRAIVLLPTNMKRVHRIRFSQM
jgi:hypothetical protein